MDKERIKTFYTRQDEWCHCYRGPIREVHRENAEMVKRVVGPPPKEILELGGGGGQSAALSASMGYDVVLVELNRGFAAHARELSKSISHGTMTVVEGDFYQISYDSLFHGICYFDGFGIGQDSHQRELLHRIYRWLRSRGKVLLEIYSPWYWAEVSPKRVTIGSIYREYGFEAYGSRMVDTWWREGEEEKAISQSLRCYSPADLQLLLEGTGLILVDVIPRGPIDEVRPPDSLAQSMSYVAILEIGSH